MKSILVTFLLVCSLAFCQNNQGDPNGKFDFTPHCIPAGASNANCGMSLAQLTYNAPNPQYQQPDDVYWMQTSKLFGQRYNPGGNESPIPGTTFSNTLPHLGYGQLLGGLWNSVKDFANAVYMSNIHPDEYWGNRPHLMIGLANPVEFGPVRYLEGDELKLASQRVVQNLHPEVDPSSLLKEKNLLHTQMVLEDGYNRELEALQNATEDWVNAGTPEDAVKSAAAMKAHAANYRMIEGALNKLVWTYRLAGPTAH